MVFFLMSVMAHCSVPWRQHGRVRGMHALSRKLRDVNSIKFHSLCTNSWLHKSLRR